MKQKKKIAYLLKMFPRFAETFILNEILELERQGVLLHLISLKQPNESFRQEKVSEVKSWVTYIPEPIKITPVMFVKNFKSMWPVIKANLKLYAQNPGRYREVWRTCVNLRDRKAKKRFLVAGYIARLLIDEGIQHIHAHFANDPATVARFVHLLTGISFSFTAHAKDIYLSEKQALQEKIHDASFVTTCTRCNRKYLQEISLNGTPIHAIYHGLDSDIFLNGHGHQRHLSKGLVQPPLILSVGRLVEKKGFDCLIEACHLLKKWDIPFRCEIIGQGLVEDELRNHIEKFEIADKLQILPFIPQEQLVAKYAQADLFALPCQITENGDRDGIPNVLVEAMAMGVPVVATNISGISEVIKPGKNGLLVPSQNPMALAKALKTVLLKPESSRDFGQQGRKMVEQNFDLTANIARLKTLFEVNQCSK